MLRWIGCAVIVASFVCWPAAAQVKPAGQTAAQKPTVVQAPPPMLRPLSQPRATQAKPAAKPGCGDKSTNAAPTPSPTGPQPLFACENIVSQTEPVWEGQQMQFKFDIANRGEGELHIRMKGG